MYIDLLKTYIIKNLLNKHSLKTEDMKSLINELIKRNIKFNSIYNFKVSNLHDILKITAEDIGQLFDFKEITINQEMYHYFLTYIMIDNYSNKEEEFILFFNNLIENKDDFYTIEKSKDLISYIKNKEDAKVGNYEEINRVSSFRKADLIEAFYVLPIYKPLDRIKIVKQMESKGYIDELENFQKPSVQVYLGLSYVISKCEDIVPSIEVINECYDKLSDVTKKEISFFLDNKTLKEFLKDKLMDNDDFELFDKAWEFAINYKQFTENLKINKKKNIEKALLEFMENNQNKTFKEVFKLYKDIDKIEYVSFDLELDDDFLNIFEKENVIEETIHPYKEIIGLIKGNHRYQDIYKDSYLEFIKDIKIDEQSPIDGRNSLSNQSLIQETIRIKYDSKILTTEELNNYLKIMSYEELEREKYLVSDGEDILGNIDYNDITNLLILKNIYPLIPLEDNVKVEIITENYKKQNKKEYNVLLDILTTNQNIVELLLNVRE